MPDLNKNCAQTVFDIARMQDMTLENLDAPSLVSVPEGFRLEDTEEYQEHRNRFRGRYDTESSKSFAQYVADRKTVDKCFVDKTNLSAMRCQAIFNLGDEEQAGHADDVANLVLPITDEFNALRSLSRVSQSKIVDFIQDYAHCLTFSDQDEDSEQSSNMSFSHALKAFRSVTVKTAKEMTSNVGDLNASKSALERIEADSAIRLPRFVHMTTSLYEDLPEVVVTARVAIITDGDSLGLSLRIVAQQKELNDAAQRFVDLVTDILPKETPIYVGTFQP